MYYFLQYHCCGAESYYDFESKGSPYKDANVNDNAAISGINGDVYAPVACCKTLPTSAAERDTCAGNGGMPSETDSNFNKVNHVYIIQQNEICLGGVMSKIHLR